MSFIFVDVEAGPAPGVGILREFGAVEHKTRRTFHGYNAMRDTFDAFEYWLKQVSDGRPVFVSDNPAYDWQWINFYFWKHLGRNPFGHSARRIGDFYAGLVHNWYETQAWKGLRQTPHDHNPVHDALGNLEAWEQLMKQTAEAKGTEA